ncbi:MAG: flagellar basal-body rod protein FlgB [Gammaproteobacteria bacterium (ex Lamellibrachia satsuma)]|nr:MAG: glycosyltransferase [Gammaproteobacteria bacterium (ex Lamellibrachia satsuma)]RRS32961.1 MAG: flagellar basal-body rod protein FlgB [Gammaproteobacteria bacterium (ex Lamellibrachia satsuma)]RRS33380.1 MAG: flagellar basal-body rod protein FlgB [Gammaproteobacteria bacterium (ex Lamellibrachia satsuma)]
MVTEFLHPDGGILLFAKAPRPGEVKTRLIPALGEGSSTALYQRLLERLVNNLSEDQVAPIELWCAPDTRHPRLQRFHSEFDIPLYQQQGDDLGERMAFAADEALQHRAYIVLIGVDCPALTSVIVDQALQSLRRGSDAVLIPAEDGGYVLLGLRRTAECLFQDISWGSETVAEATRQCLDELGWQWEELPVLWDLDRPEDLPRLRELGLDLDKG